MGLYEKLSKNSRLFLSVSGMELTKFKQLFPAIQQEYTKSESERKKLTVQTKEHRKRRPGGGNAFDNSLEDRILMVLLYHRVYVSYDFMLLLFTAKNKSVISRNISQLRPIIEKVLPLPAQVRERVIELARKESEVRTQRRKVIKQRISDVELFREAYPELTLLIDGTEQRKRRSGKKDQQKEDYSGKQGYHTIKQQIIATPNGLILDQSPSVGGSNHDFALFKEDKKNRGVLGEFDDLRAVVYVDSGYQGINDQGLKQEIRLIERAKRNKPLTRAQKELNHIRGKTRVKVENAIARLKKYASSAQVYRNSDSLYDQITRFNAGLVNLRIISQIEAQTGVPFF